jgi:hypothetical protein
MVHHTHANTRHVVKQLVLSKAASRLLVLGLGLLLFLACKGCLHCSSVTREACTGKDRMASDDEVLITSASFIVMHSLVKMKSRRKRRWWMISVFRSRDGCPTKPRAFHTR